MNIFFSHIEISMSVNQLWYFMWSINIVLMWPFMMNLRTQNHWWQCLSYHFLIPNLLSPTPNNILIGQIQTWSPPFSCILCSIRKVVGSMVMPTDKQTIKWKWSGGMACACWRNENALYIVHNFCNGLPSWSPHKLLIVQFLLKSF